MSVKLVGFLVTFVMLGIWCGRMPVIASHCHTETTAADPATTSAGKIEKANPGAATAVLRTARADEIGKKAACPVMKSNLKIKKGTEAADYRGKAYYFCCPGCPAEFKKNPDKT